MTIEIPLTQGKVALIDDADLPLVEGHKWYALKVKRTFYAVTNIRKPDGKQTLILMHRTILQAKHGEMIDHRDGNGLDNRRHNMRPATYHQNNWNARKMLGTSSQYKGVCFRPRLNKWEARITHNAQTITLGHFDNEMDAATSYDTAARKYHGEFARLNFS